MTAIAGSNKRNAAMRPFLRVVFLAFSLLAVFLLDYRASAQQQSRGPADAPEESVTQHTFRIGGRVAAFTATAGTLPLANAKGEQLAGMFYVAYTRDGTTHDSRPITFVFNGGPGVSSAFLHLAALGPRIVEFGPEGQLPPPPNRLGDNPDNWLDLSDLVFVDPVGTSYSRTIANNEEANKRYWGVREDLDALATFIEIYLARNNRQASPKYLVGESYGGFRAARLPQLLASDHGIGIAGVFLISPVLEFSLLRGDRFALLPDALRLPSYAAVALERTMTPTRAALAEVERFALGRYLSALANPRSEAVRQIYAAVARYIGLPEAIVAQHGGRVPVDVFIKEARRADKLLISRYDGSVSAPDPYPESTGARGDPVYDGLRTALTSTMADYLTQELGVRTDIPYRLTNGGVLRQWNWRSGLSGGQGYPGAADELREALAGSRNFKIVIAHGMTDLVTPYLASRYVIDHLPPSLTTDRVTLNLYPGGHMMYLRAISRANLHADAARLYPPPL